MALNETRDITEARTKANARLMIAQDNTAPADQADRLRVQADLRQAFAEAAYILEADVADSREKSLALTKIEEALMWGGKAIFS